MYIRNLSKQDITFRCNNKNYLFIKGELTLIEDGEIPYIALEKAYGGHILSLVEDKYINNDHIGSNFEDFLKEEGILKEVEDLAKKKIEEFTNLDNNEDTKENENGSEEKTTTTETATCTTCEKTECTCEKEEEKVETPETKQENTNTGETPVRQVRQRRINKK